MIKMTSLTPYPPTAKNFLKKVYYKNVTKNRRKWQKEWNKKIDGQEHEKKNLKGKQFVKALIRLEILVSCVVDWTGFIEVEGVLILSQNLCLVYVEQDELMTDGKLRRKP